MTKRTEHVLVLGVDGMDPKLTKQYMDEGKLTHIQTLLKRGAAREDLVLLGALPTITPPLWTTLATGAYPGTHGITCFWGQSMEMLDTLVYNLDSTRCRAEPLWNVTAENGLMTLVWHWPGSSWPPTSDSSYLHVVDGVSPSCIQMTSGGVQGENIVLALPEIETLDFVAGTDLSGGTGAGCIITDLPPVDVETLARKEQMKDGKTLKNIILSPEDGEAGFSKGEVDITNSPLKPAKNWQFAIAPQALEFTIITSEGKIHHPALLTASSDKGYDTVTVYRNKKEQEPIVTLHPGEFVMAVDEVIKNDRRYEANRLFKILELEPDGSKVRLFLSWANDIHNEDVWYPHAIYHEICANVGYVPPYPMPKGDDVQATRELIQPMWEIYTKWQADALNYLIAQNRYDVVISHLHNVDAQGHYFWHLAKQRSELGNDASAYQQMMEDCYIDTDRYIGRFLHLLDQGWTIFLVSDHGLLCHVEDDLPLIGDAFGINIGVMKELGYTVMQQDSQGNELKAIDWSRTRAVASRGDHIWINLKGRNATGIVEPAEQYDLERQIIDDLYNYRYHGKRVIALALRNKDALLLGMSGPECGDIIYFLEENFNQIHGNALSTQLGYAGTSVSPLFIAAGSGIKRDYLTQRVIRQVDVAPTIAALLEVPMPDQCEGAPVYQIMQ